MTEAANYNPHPDALRLALSDLLQRIAAGEEYPDAEWRVSFKHRLPAEDLRRAYDDH